MSWPEILPILALSYIPNIHSGIGVAATSIRLSLSPATMNCTADIPPYEAYFTEHGVADFRVIRDGDHRLSWNRFNDEHDKCVEFIRGSLINGAFTSDLNSLMESLPINYWIYGHSHRNIDREIGGVKCVSNQLGYTFSKELGDFKRDKIIAI